MTKYIDHYIDPISNILIQYIDHYRIIYFINNYHKRFKISLPINTSIIIVIKRSNNFADETGFFDEI